ncbi:uncharacterized protein EDB93DRAFT_1178490 [Suillus bovinus]|uniref:uncharacterized protein n=1 Tax=Suillus bovinus TaxID=48563 RepID=UPI001B87E1F5|nr:uncharacterized protein EDB93DRAFT_1178490 [Suillus bovinus]KAG2131300.1 hypothetical protein EDB93DRAFT_1178490 [Suillus bovinus]
MDGARSCLLCCQTCIGNGVGNEHDKSNPFALDNLLSAGTISVDFQGRHLHCAHIHASDTWHPVPSCQLSVCVEDDVFCKISFLTEHQFLRATCCLGTSQRVLYIRIYLVPTDLKSAKESLRLRSEAVLKEGRRHLQALLPSIVQDRHSWNADELPSTSQPQKYFLPRDIDNRTMAEIYSDLPSLFSSKIAVRHEIRGLRSTLYEYQRQSVAVMIEKELSNQPVQDPLYIPISNMHGERFYFQPSILTVVRECPTVARCKGGILCEELGTGKTVMVLGLILATINQLSHPEESLLDYRPVMSPLAYRTFPADEYHNARRRAGMHKSLALDVTHVPSLVEILLHRIRTWGDKVDTRSHEERLEASNLWHLLQANTPFYHHYLVKSHMHGLGPSRTRDRVSAYPRLMHLTTATLVVVPVNLLGQWGMEILKHCHSTLRYLIVRQTTKIPSAKVLASDYDVRFRRESVKNKVAHLCKFKPCTCAPFPGSRVPDCRCPGDPDLSPLLQIRWKRLVIDEGHTSGNTAAALNNFVRELSIERKWIVTGTPTSNILGLSLGRKQDEDIENGIGIDNTYSLPIPATTECSSSDSSSISDGDAENTVRVWGTYDYVNLRKLGAMISDFLAVPQFHSDLKLFGSHVSAPLCDRRGPRVGAVKVLSQVMEMVMVRHRIEDVEEEVVLPPMRHTPIYMDLDAYAAKSYNAMQASIAINAIDSQREGQDYMFHPRNAKSLQIAMDNLSQGMFWSVSDILFNVDQIRHEAPKFLARATAANMPDHDMALLEEALAHAEAIAKDPLWRAMQHHEDVPFHVTGMDAAVFEAWTRGRLKDRSRVHDLMHANRLCDLRALVRNQPLMNLSRLVEEGKALDFNERARCEKKSTQVHDVTNAAQMKKMVSEVKDELEVIKEKEKIYQTEDVPETHIDDLVRRKLGHHDAPSPSNLLSLSPLSGTCVGPSLSTKLNFVLVRGKCTVLEYSEKEKFLIFSNSPLTLAHIAEALSLIEIKYLRYTTDMSPPLREQCVMTFESSETFRVFLMELKLGARGLNLISASRVIFCEPVWHPDVEAQAIKRAHRIGQTKPITVKTLVIKHTAEETMVARRHLLKGSSKIPRMTAEVGMRHFMENPRFLAVPIEPEHFSSSFQIPLLMYADPQGQTHTSEDSATLSAPNINIINTSDDTVDRALKRPRTVRFAD